MRRHSSRALYRRRELENEILPDTGSVNMRLLSPPLDVLNLRQLVMIQEADPLDIGPIDAMGGTDTPSRYAMGIKDADLDSLARRLSRFTASALRTTCVSSRGNILLSSTCAVKAAYPDVFALFPLPLACPCLQEHDSPTHGPGYNIGGTLHE